MKLVESAPNSTHFGPRSRGVTPTRMLFQQRVRDLLIIWGARFLVTSLVLLGLALVGGVTLIVDTAVGSREGRAFGGWRWGPSHFHHAGSGGALHSSPRQPRC